jgi:hypothetical protein
LRRPFFACCASYAGRESAEAPYSEGGSKSVLSLLRRGWIASRSLSSGARSRDPLARNDEETCVPVLATWLPEVLRIRCPSLEERGRRECRVRAAPAVSCAKRLRIGAHEHTGQRRTLRHPPRNGFTAYSALSPATNSFCHRHLRIGSSAGPVGPTSPPQTWHQQRMPGPHSFTVRNRVARLVCRSIAHEVHLALQSQARTTLPRPPHPIPTLVTMANAPPRG